MPRHALRIGARLEKPVARRAWLRCGDGVMQAVVDAEGPLFKADRRKAVRRTTTGRVPVLVWGVTILAVGRNEL
jgi:hypothetical protein